MRDPTSLSALQQRVNRMPGGPVKERFIADLQALRQAQRAMSMVRKAILHAKRKA